MTQHVPIHRHQREIKYGDYTVRFVDLGNGIIEFGQVQDMRQVIEAEESCGETRASAEQAWRATVRANENQDLLYMRVHTRLEVRGLLGHTHRSHVWPIEKRLFDFAKAVDFDYRVWGSSEVGDEDETDAARFLLELAFQQHKAAFQGRL